MAAFTCHDKILEAIKAGRSEEVEKALLVAIASSSTDNHDGPSKQVGSESHLMRSSRQRVQNSNAATSSFDVNATLIGDRRATLLHIAAEFGSTETEVLDVVLRHGGDIDAVDDEGWTPLHYAAAAGNAHVIIRLLEHCVVTCVNDQVHCSFLVDGASSNDLRQDDVDRRSFSPTNSSKILQRIHEFINSPDKFGQTPLHVAAEHSKGTCVLALMHAGADRHAKDSSRRSAADLLRNAAMIAIMGNPHHPKRREFAESELGKDIEWVLSTGTRRRGVASPSAEIGEASLDRAPSSWTMSTLLEGLAAAGRGNQRLHGQRHHEEPAPLRRSMNDSGRSSVNSVCDVEGNDMLLVATSAPQHGVTASLRDSLETEVNELRREVARLQSTVVDLRLEMCRMATEAHTNHQMVIDRINRNKKEAKESRKQIVVFFANEIDNLKKQSKTGKK